jgi:hypothetical protein
VAAIVGGLSQRMIFSTSTYYIISINDNKLNTSMLNETSSWRYPLEKDLVAGRAGNHFKGIGW